MIRLRLKKQIPQLNQKLSCFTKTSIIKIHSNNTKQTKNLAKPTELMRQELLNAHLCAPCALCLRRLVNLKSIVAQTVVSSQCPQGFYIVSFSIICLLTWHVAEQRISAHSLLLSLMVFVGFGRKIIQLECPNLSKLK